MAPSVTTLTVQDNVNFFKLNIGNSQPQSSNIVTIDVGGQIFQTTKQTLALAGPKSLLFDLANSTQLGPTFIDRDPDLFSLLLSLLRTGTLPSKAKCFDLQDLIAESQFFNIEPLLINSLSNPSQFEPYNLEKSLSLPLNGRDFPSILSTTPFGTLHVAHGSKITSFDWSLRRKSTILTHFSAIDSLLAFSPTVAAAGATDFSGLQIVDLEKGFVKECLSWENVTRSGSTVQAIGSNSDLLFASFESGRRNSSSIMVYDLKTFSPVTEIGHCEIFGADLDSAIPATKLKWVESYNMLLASGSHGGPSGVVGNVRLWDIRSGQVVWELKEKVDCFSDITVSDSLSAMLKVGINSGEVFYVDMRMLGSEGSGFHDWPVNPWTKASAMDRLVKPDVKELEISFKKGQKCTTTFRLTNLMHTMAVAVSLTSSNPSIFSFTQPFSVIPPLSSASYTLILSQAPSSDHLPLSTPPDFVTVRSSMLPTGKAHQDDLHRLFSRPGPHVFRDATIPVYLVGRHVADLLIANHAKFAHLSSYFYKATCFCTDSQLTALLKPAVLSGNANMVSGLVDQGGDVNCKDSDGRSLISLAVRGGNMDVLKVLIGARCEIDGSIDRVLHEAAGLSRVDLMAVLHNHFKDAIDVNSADSCGRTAIHVAASFGFVGGIRFCVSVGGEVDVFDCDGSSPLHLAAEKGHQEAVEFLLDCSNFAKYALNKHGKTAFAVAVENGHSNLYELLHLGDVLQRAARVDDVNAIKSCLADGANVNGRDQNGWTPLHRAAFKGRVDSVKVLLNHGAQVDVVDDAGYTPLHCAVEAGHAQVALLLIAHGAKSNSKSLKSMVPSNLNCLKNHPPVNKPLHQEKECA